MANSNALIVEVVGDTSKLKAGLKDAQRQLTTFSSRTSTIKSTGADALLADVRRMRSEAAGLKEQMVAADAANAASTASMLRFGAAAAGVGLAASVAARNLSELDGQAGRVGNSINSLLSLDFVGFWRNVRREVGPTEQALAQTGDTVKLLALANNLAGTSFDNLAKKARAAAAAIVASQPSFVDPTKIRDSTSPGVIAAETSGLPLPKPGAGRTGVTATQRNQWFDAGIARQIDRVQDLKTVKEQVAALNQIEAEIQKRIDVTKDITRKLNLEDQLARVERQKQGIIAGGAAGAKAAAEAAKAARDAAAADRQRRAQQLAALEAARQQARQSLALGDFTPSTANLRKQLASLTNRIADSGLVLSSKLKQNLAGARSVLAGEFGKATEESRNNIANLFDTIRAEFDKQGKKGVTGGALTKTTSLNTDRILDGLGLGRDAERTLRARLSHFNSAGKALAGATTATSVGGVNVIVRLDGRPIEAVVTARQQQRTRRNPAKRRG